MPARPGGAAGAALEHVRKACAWRVELTTLALLVWAAHWADRHGLPAQIAFSGLVAFLCLPGPGKRWLFRVVHRSSVRRRWAKGCRHAGLETFNERIPHIRRHRFVPAGDLLTVRVPAGECVGDLEAEAEVLAAYLRLREVRVARDEDNAKHAAVTLVRRDPLAGTVAVDWPHVTADRLSLWEPIPVGVDEDGQPVSVELVERNLLIGGDPARASRSPNR